MHLSRVFQFAVASGRAERDPSRDLGGALSPTKEKHLASITDPQEVGALLRAIDAYEGAWITPLSKLCDGPSVIDPATLTAEFLPASPDHLARSVCRSATDARH